MQKNEWKLNIGASIADKGRIHFRVWAPRAKKLTVEVISGKNTKKIPLKKNENGYFDKFTEKVLKGDRYLYILDDTSHYPDPASRFQPEGVHGFSQIINPDDFEWEDNDWKGIALKDFIIYELHVGTFSKEGRFESIISHLDYLKELGVTAIELMPVSQFPGERNWGYDGVYPFAPQNSYGVPDGLKTLINACHKKGLAVILDVVYNHLGPEGNYLSKFGPYFTDRYKTPWGDAVNFDGPYSDEVRYFFISNALYWVSEYHIDALRIDAIHGIFDFSAKHFLQELGEAVHLQAKLLNRNIYVITESDLNDVRIINPIGIGGYGLDAQWNDDFHHSLHTLITDENNGYYEDFGKIKHLGKAFKEGFVYSGQYSKFRKRGHGSASKQIQGNQLIVFSQNHDQVGNRMIGDRLSQSQSFEELKLAAGAVFFSPYIPLLFMGEEYGEKSLFQYFVSHSDENLIEAVRKGRKEEFAAFNWKEEISDPQDERTFLNSKLDIELRRHGKHKILFEFYKEVIKIRKKIPALYHLNKENIGIEVFENERLLLIKRCYEGDEVISVYNFNKKRVRTKLLFPKGFWKRVIDSSSQRWGGRGELSEEKIESSGSQILLTINPDSFIIYRTLKTKEK